MLDKLLGSILGSGLTLGNALAIIFSAVLSGLLISLVYMITHRHESYERTLPVTLFIMPVIVSSIILLIGNNLASAFSLAGIFALIRFRADAKDSKDLSYILFTIVVGASFGTGYISYGFLASTIILILMVLLKAIKYGEIKPFEMSLKIIVPENLNYENLFDDIFLKYTSFHKLERVRTSDFGTMFELSYSITFKKELSQKEFLDELRCRNGNLNIILTMKQE